MSTGRDRAFFVLMPYCLTAAGRLASACPTRFCISMVAVSRLVPTSKVASVLRVPSFPLVDLT